MTEFLQPTSADMCEKLETLGVHIELSTTERNNLPYKIFVYCTQAESKNKTFEKGKVVGYYYVHSSFFCNEKHTAIAQCVSKLGNATGIIDFDKCPAYVLIAGNFVKFETPKLISDFTDANNDVLTRGPMRRIIVHDRH